MQLLFLTCLHASPFTAPHLPGNCPLKQTSGVISSGKVSLPKTHLTPNCISNLRWASTGCSRWSPSSHSLKLTAHQSLSPNTWPTAWHISGTQSMLNNWCQELLRGKLEWGMEMHIQGILSKSLVQTLGAFSSRMDSPRIVLRIPHQEA